jgi:hypothetical protein
MFRVRDGWTLRWEHGMWVYCSPDRSYKTCGRKDLHNLAAVIRSYRRHAKRQAKLVS